MFAGLQEPAPSARASRLRAVPSEVEIPAFLNRA
jgi:hypothetical protein